MNWPVSPERIARGLYWQEALKLVEGCTPVSRGCDNCWSARETAVRAKHPNDKISIPKQGLVELSFAPDIRKDQCVKRDQCGIAFNGSIRLREDNLDKPLRAKKPRVYAVWNDLFHEDVPEDFIRAAFTVMMSDSVRPYHKFIVLTKRADRMFGILSQWQKGGLNLLRQGIFIGVSVEDQKTADERIPLLLKTPAVKRFVSYEPALGEIDFRFDERWCSLDYDAHECTVKADHISWLIMGGESGPGARPMNPEWARSARDQCQATGVPFFFKGFGEYVPSLDVPSGYADEYSYKRRGSKNPCIAAHGETYVKIGKKAAGCLLDGREWKELPS